MKATASDSSSAEWKQFLSWPFSTRIRNFFENANINSLDRLTSFSPYDVSKYRGVGHKAISELRHALASVGRTLADDAPPAPQTPDELQSLLQEQVALEARLREIKQRVIAIKAAAKDKPTLAQTVLAHWLTTRDCAVTAGHFSLTEGKVREIVTLAYARKIRCGQLDDVAILHAWERRPDVAAICQRFDIPDFVLHRIIRQLTKMLRSPGGVRQYSSNGVFWLALGLQVPSMLGTHESIQENSAAGTDRRHPRHGAGNALPPFLGPAQKASMLAGGQESHPACRRR